MGTAVALVMAAPLSRAEANGFAHTAFVQPNDLIAQEGFGQTVAADGNIMAVSTQQAPFVVYVYVNNNGTWTQQARLTSPSGIPNDGFGSSLALQGNTLVVGDRGAHAAYIYSNVNGVWTNQAALFPTGGSGASFGGSPINGMSISGNTIAVGAPSETTPAGTTGSVYVFTNTNGVWSQEDRLVPSDPLTAAFGQTVALQNDTLLIGAPLTGSPSLFDPGTAFVFTRQNGVWTQDGRLDSSDPSAAALYGQCVSLDGNTAVVGAQRPNEVHVFVNSNGTWSEQALLNGPDDSDFGTSVKVIGDLLMVTAYDDVSTIGVQSGDAFVFTRGGSTWTAQPDLYMAPGVHNIPGPAQVLQRFGNFATMTKAGSQTIFVMGSQTYSNPNAAHVGAVYTATLN
jgi:FG-GAP repeat protein